MAKHHADHAEGLIEAVRTRFPKSGKATELLVGPGDGAAATFVITSGTPDEPRLAVLDQDVTAEDVRGQLLRWDAEAETWRPSGTEDQPTARTPSGPSTLTERAGEPGDNPL